MLYTNYMNPIDQLVKICPKYDILLEKNKSNNHFIITFKLENQNYDLIQLTDYSFFKMMADINKDILQELRLDTDNVCDQNDSEKVNMYFLFNPIAEDFGILKKCMSIQTNKQIGDNCIIFKSKNLDHIPNDMMKYDKVNCHFSQLNIDILNNHLLNVRYEFNIDIKEDLPIYMQNLIGLIMKKMFLKLKLFIENMK